MLIFLGVLLVGFMAPANAASKKSVVLALGDSITAGAPEFRSSAEFPPWGRGNRQSQYAYWLEKTFPQIKFNNRGISGQTSADILSRVDRELDQSQPKAVILMVGVNDIFRGYAPETLRANLEALYEKIQARQIPLMVLTILPYRGLSESRAKQIDAINQWIKEYSVSHELGFCDTASAMRSSSDHLKLELTRDGLHPNPEGYHRMAEAIARALRSWPPFTELSK